MHKLIGVAALVIAGILMIDPVALNTSLNTIGTILEFFLLVFGLIFVVV